MDFRFKIPLPLVALLILSCSYWGQVFQLSQCKSTLLKVMVINSTSTTTNDLDIDPQQKEAAAAAASRMQRWIELMVERVQPSWMNSSKLIKISSSPASLPSMDNTDGKHGSIAAEAYGMPTNNLVYPAFDTPIILKTNLGLIEGVKSLKFNKNLYTFLGVPYAQPPTNELRFKLPAPIKKWQGVMQATKWPPFCVQPAMFINTQAAPIHILTQMMNEDCLYLNIWTSSLKYSKSHRRPVMAFIHGGAFQYGGISLDETDGSALALLGNVVVVTMNYRLGVFGFLNANNKQQAPNNVGLFDQRLALEWIQENIKSFGGDPAQVTLFGESAGGHSVGLHMISPPSFPLFKRAILQSGVPLSYIRSYDSNSDTAGMSRSETLGSLMVARRLNCLLMSNDSEEEPKSPQDSSTSISSSAYNDDADLTDSIDEPYLDNATIDCMRNKTSLELLKALGTPGSTVFSPTAEDKNGFFPAGNIKDAYEPRFPKIGPQKEFLVGLNNDEGAFMLHYGMPNVFPMKSQPLVSNFEAFKDKIKSESREGGQAHLFKPLIRSGSEIFDQFNRNSNQNSKELANITKEEKFGKQISSMVTDILFLCPAKSFSRILAEANRTVYFYLYNYRSSQTPYHKWFGATHHDEVGYVFGRPIRLADIHSGQDIEISQRLIKTWAQFAHHGTTLAQLGQRWPAYYQNEQDYYMTIQPNNATIRTGLHERFCNLYDNVISVHLQDV